MAMTVAIVMRVMTMVAMTVAVMVAMTVAVMVKSSQLLWDLLLRLRFRLPQSLHLRWWAPVKRRVALVLAVLAVLVLVLEWERRKELRKSTSSVGMHSAAS